MAGASSIVGVEPKQAEDGVFVVVVGLGSFLNEILEFVIPFVVDIGVSLRFVLQHLDSATGNHVFELKDQGGVLVGLP